MGVAPMLIVAQAEVSQVTIESGPAHCHDIIGKTSSEFFTFRLLGFIALSWLASLQNSPKTRLL
jgi:hypothetical protein